MTNTWNTFKIHICSVIEIGNYMPFQSAKNFDHIYILNLVQNLLYYCSKTRPEHVYTSRSDSHRSQLRELRSRERTSLDEYILQTVFSEAAICVPFYITHVLYSQSVRPGFNSIGAERRKKCVIK